MNEKILENKRLFLNFLGVTHSRGLKVLKLEQQKLQQKQQMAKRRLLQ